jgi:acyl-CoA reductase-like NAD-dependent aldehyde dehydrogenase
MVDIDNQLVKTIASRVIAELERGRMPADGRHSPAGSTGDGVFDRVEDAVQGARAAQQTWAGTSLQVRGKVIARLRTVMHEHAEEFSRMAREETGMGRVPDKILKHHNAADATPGIEDLSSRSFSGDRGLVVEEFAPYGVVAAVTPSTHPIPVLLNSVIIITACGNSAVFSVHPAAQQVSAHAMAVFNHAIQAAGGPPNLITMIRKPTMEAVDELFRHPDIALIAATGGPALVAAAFRSGKKVIAAGPGNPPVLVDETASLANAAEQIILGAGFDNNILCIAEKEIFVVDAVFDRFNEAMQQAGAVALNRLQVQALTERVFSREANGGWRLNRELVGKNASALAKAAGRLTVSDDVRILFGETEFDHPFVQEEQMMPFLPVVRVRDAREGIELAVRAEHGYRHTAMIHSNNLETITEFAKALNTSIVVVNGSSLAGNGPPAGEGYFSHTISSPTGEGVCTPRDFARIRRICVKGALRIV